MKGSVGKLMSSSDQPWYKSGAYKADGVYPTFIADLQNDRYAVNGVAVPDPFTHTRASNGYDFNSSGDLTQYATNVKRIGFDATTLVSEGRLIEDARTNSIRNNTMVGVASGTPGTLPTNWQNFISAGLTQQIVGSGTENGIAYIDWRISGTASGASGSAIIFEANTGIAATVGQLWAHSCFIRLVGGSAANTTAIQLQIAERDAGGANLATQSGTDIKGTISSALLRTQRYTQNITMAQATAAFVRPSINVAYNNGAVIDITLRIGLPQIEFGAMTTSPILTSGSAATRAVDSCSGAVTMSGSVGTIIARFMFPYLYTTAPSCGAKLDDGTGAANGLELRTASAHSVYASDAVINSTALVNINVATYGSVSAGATLKQAIAYSTGNSRAAGGGTLGTASVTAFAAGTFNRLIIGNNSTGNRTCNGYTMSVLLYSGVRLIDATIQSKTA